MNLSNLILFVSVVLVFGQFNGIYSQEILERDNFWKIIWDANSKSDSVKHQKTQESKSKRGGNSYDRKEVYRFIPPNRSYIFTEDSTPDGIERSEAISIGKTQYYKNGNGEWEFIPESTIASDGSGVGDIPKDSNANVKSNAEYKFIGNTILNGKRVREYSFISIDQYSATKHFYFINEKGFLLKKQEEFSAGDFIRKGSEIYEFDLEFQILAPKLKPQKQNRNRKIKRQNRFIVKKNT